jgi:hypothetical protein
MMGNMKKSGLETDETVSTTRFAYTAISKTQTKRDWDTITRSVTLVSGTEQGYIYMFCFIYNLYDKN